MKLSLVVMNAGKASGQVIPINLAQFTIGRDPQCNLRPASALISKRHCALLVRDGEVFLRDFDSTNGSSVNEEPVKGEVAVKNGDVLKIGPLQFKVAIEATKVQPKAGAATKPTPQPQTVPEGLKPTKASSDTAADDDIAAMLLSLPGEETSEASTALGEQIPSGSTVMDMIPPKNEEGRAAETATPDQQGTPKPQNKKDEAKPDKKADPAHVAARAILEKYARRGRS
ncbi:MAG: FHA domain-containing protein [Gemmataceae bacterium]